MDTEAAGETAEEIAEEVAEVRFGIDFSKLSPFFRSGFSARPTNMSIDSLHGLGAMSLLFYGDFEKVRSSEVTLFARVRTYELVAYLPLQPTSLCNATLTIVVGASSPGAIYLPQKGLLWMCTHVFSVVIEQYCCPSTFV